MNKRRLGYLVLSASGLFCAALNLLAFLRGGISLGDLLFSIGICAFSIYTVGGTFFDYPVTYRTTIGPGDPPFMRKLQVCVGIIIFGASIYKAVKFLHAD